MTNQQSLIDLDSLAEQTNKTIQTSRQPKNNPTKDQKSAGAFITNIRNMVKKAELFEPAYSPKSSIRDQWLRDFVRNETFLGGTVSTCVSLDTNRGYTIVGGRNQVVRYSRVLRNVENGNGWRELKQLGAQDYYITDMGQVTEVETDGRNGPLVSLYHVDAARCQLTGNPKTPLVYTPYNGKEQAWKPEWFYRICSLPNPDERYYKLGFSPVSRALKLGQIMIAVIDHDIEKLNTLLPKGMLTLESDEITQEMWDAAWDEHLKVYPARTGNEYYDGIITLVARAIKVNLIPFSKMPEQFDQFKFIDYMMKGYALCFNRDPRAFWSFNSGSFGSGTETAVQSEKATQAGYIDYLFQDQEHLQKLLPASILFQYEEDDTSGKILKAELLSIWADAGLKLVELGMSTTDVLSIMVKEGILDSEFTPEVEEEIATDDENVLQYRRKQLIEKEQVQQAVQRFPDEPIVEYKWPDNKTILLWKQGSDAIKKYFQINGVQHIKPKGSRQRIIQQQDNKFKEIAKLAENGDIDKEELKERFVTYQLSKMVVEYFDNATTADNRTAVEQQAYDAALAYSENDALLESNPISDNETAEEQKAGFELALLLLLLPGVVQEQFAKIYAFGLDSDLFDELEAGYFEDHDLDYRIGLWEGALLTAAMYGFLVVRGGDENELLIWNRSNVDSCITCLSMDGTVRTRLEWQSSLPLPRVGTICNGACKCGLVPV